MSGHIFWNCPKAREAQSCSKVVASISLFSCQSLQDLLWNMLMIDRVKEEKVAKAVTIAWAYGIIVMR